MTRHLRAWNNPARHFSLKNKARNLWAKYYQIYVGIETRFDHFRLFQKENLTRHLRLQKLRGHFFIQKTQPDIYGLEIDPKCLVIKTVFDHFGLYSK